MIPAKASPNAAIAMQAIGLAAVVAGGLVAAVTDPLDLERGSWVAAYLVLVAGVAQGAMGAARRHHPEREPSRRLGWTQLVAWNAGSLAVVVGTLVGRPLLVDAGSVLLGAALIIAFAAARTGPAELPVRRWFFAYRLVLIVLVVSVPIGMVLSHVRH